MPLEIVAIRKPDGTWMPLSETVTHSTAYNIGYEMMSAYIAGFQTPTRWQRFCYWFRDFWLEERYF